MVEKRKEQEEKMRRNVTSKNFLWKSRNNGVLKER